MATGRQGRRLNGLVIILLLDHVCYAVTGSIVTKIVTVYFHYTMIRAAPRARRGPARADNDNAARARQNIVWTMTLRDVLLPRARVGDAHYISAGIQCKLLDLLCTSFGWEVIQCIDPIGLFSVAIIADMTPSESASTRLAGRTLPNRARGVPSLRFFRTDCGGLRRQNPPISGI